MIRELDMNDEELKMYYVGKVTNLERHISNLESLITDISFEISEYYKKIKKIEQSQKNDEL